MRSLLYHRDATRGKRDLDRAGQPALSIFHQEAEAGGGGVAWEAHGRWVLGPSQAERFMAP